VGFLEKILTSVVLKLVEILTDFLMNRAEKVKKHSDESSDLKEKAEQVEKSAAAIKDAVKQNKEVTREMADALKERNRRLRGGGILK